MPGTAVGGGTGTVAVGRRAWPRVEGDQVGPLQDMLAAGAVCAIVADMMGRAP